ncbi:MAG: hypothetical protein EZS28_040026 [Streblomastix strix]|uniref:Uncharacterized protein n=1 Tax=Streblomastix strix TaxID=222440 RepID=A0A5J4U1K9_9EUKA|nr:MAG: hypothetical protein EZS28_040026 [Streblomastix strix]
MTFNILLLAIGLALAASEQFHRGIVQDGVLSVSGKDLDVTIETGKKAKYGDPSKPTLNLLPVDLKAHDWINLDDAGLTAGEKQYYEDGFYDFQAAILYAYNKKDIRPSYWYIKDCAPKKASGDTDVFAEAGTVPNWEYISFIRGVNDADVCYGTEPSEDPDKYGKCQYTCPKDESKSPFQNSYGKGILLKGSLSPGYKTDELKQRIGTFGPILTIASGEENRIFYGWNETGLLYLVRDKGDGYLKKKVVDAPGGISKAYIAHQAFDCDNSLTKKTKRIDCECPPIEDVKAYKEDTRTATKKFCTASGATRAAWTVIATVLLLPLLSMW